MSVAKQKLIILETVDSTNNYAMAMVQNGTAASGDAVFAIEQTMGKGTRGKHWKSNKGDNIIISVMAQMHWQPVQQQFPLSVAIAIACLHFIKKFITGDVFIKWPNDIFINDSKAGGILIENVIKGNLWQWAVIGIGINVHQTEFGELNATSLKKMTSKEYNVIALAKELHGIIIQNIEFLQADGFTEMLKEYNENLFNRDKMVKLKKENVLFETIITGVTEDGSLVTHDAIERKFKFGEIEWVNA